MTQEQIYQTLVTTGLPVTYNFFEIGQMPELPYIVYTLPSRDDFLADNLNYVSIVTINVELYTQRKSNIDEARVETVLAASFPPYEKSTAWISSENMQMTTYTMEVILNG